MKKIEFEKVYDVYESLTQAFHQEELEAKANTDEEVIPDQKMLSLWILFLVTAGWDEDTFWAELDRRAEQQGEDSSAVSTEAPMTPKKLLN